MPRSKSLRHSGASAACCICCSVHFQLPWSMACRSDGVPRKYPWANNSISRTLSFVPAIACTKRSISAEPMPFMRMNGRSVTMYE